MWFEILFIFVFLFFAALFFYKQALEDFDILQIEATQIDQLPTLLSEKSFLVVRSLPTLNLWSSASVRKVPRILQAPYGKYTVADILEGQPPPLFFPPFGEELARQTGVQTWIDITWLPRILPNPLFRWMYTTRCEACIGEKGLRKSVAYSTLVFSTEGELQISILPESSQTYLPAVWVNRQFQTIQRADAPLLGEIKFMDIRLRPGSMLCIPPHWIINIAQEGTIVPWFLWVEIHHPISKVAASSQRQHS